MDSGHVKQVATFEKLLGFCNAHGAMFNPSKEALQPTALSSLLTSAQHSLEAVKVTRTEYINAVHARNEAFNSLPKFLTRIVNALAATEASKSTVEEAYSFVRKFYRFKSKAPAVGSEEAEPRPTRSLSQLDFDSKIDNFEALVKVVTLEPSYQPNEVDLQVDSLKERVASLRAMNSEVISKLVTLSNARATRNKLLYARSGIHGLGLATKRYVKGAFGYQSVAYDQIRSLRFQNQKNV
jgi:hypothetical protein